LRQRQKSTKRSRIELYATVLEVIKRYPEGARITKMSYGVGVPIDRLKAILQNLVSYGLVQTAADDEGDDDDKKVPGGGGVFYVLTPRAFEFLETYWKMRGFLEVFGAGGIGGEF
jgi:predicted transcriptional regulator